MKRLLHRHQPKAPLLPAIKAGICGIVGIGVTAGLSHYSGIPWMVAPFGATCVLLFSAPAAPLSQPINIVAGHMVSSIVGLAIAALFPTEWWSLALAVGLAITLMHLLRVTHPPAGANPIVIMLTHPGWDFLIFPILAGSLLLVACAMALRHLPPRTAYPLALPIRED